MNNVLFLDLTFLMHHEIIPYMKDNFEAVPFMDKQGTKRVLNYTMELYMAEIRKSINIFKFNNENKLMEFHLTHGNSIIDLNYIRLDKYVTILDPSEHIDTYIGLDSNKLRDYMLTKYGSKMVPIKNSRYKKAYKFNTRENMLKFIENHLLDIKDMGCS